MSIYRSEIVLTNVSQEDVTVDGSTLPPGSSITCWNMRESTVIPSVLSKFQALQADYANLSSLVSEGKLQCVQDGLTLTFDQFLLLWSQLVSAMEKATELTQFLAPVKAAPAQDDGVPLVATAPRTGSDWVIGSHNFSDPCTWFQDSVRVKGEVLVDSGDGLTFGSAHPSWIDLYSGRQHNEGFWVYLQSIVRPDDPHGYRAIIYVDGVPAVAREAFEATGGDYEVIWETGKIVFFASVAGKTVTADYSYATTSYFHVGTRDPAKILIVEDAETDVSLDAIVQDELVYSWWVLDPATSTWSEAGSYSYKRLGQIITEAKGQYPVFKATGCTAQDREMPLPEFRRKCRGMYADRQAVPFNYLCARNLPAGVEIRIYLRHHRAMGGESVTATLYCSEIQATA